MRRKLSYMPNTDWDRVVRIVSALPKDSELVVMRAFFSHCYAEAMAQPAVLRWVRDNAAYICIMSALQCEPNWNGKGAHDE